MAPWVKAGRLRRSCVIWLLPWGSVTLSTLPAVTLEPARRHCYENMFIIILINIIIIINNMIFGAFMHINFKQACAVAGTDAATNKQLQRGSLIYIKSFMLIWLVLCLQLRLTHHWVVRCAEHCSTTELEVRFTRPLNRDAPPAKRKDTQLLCGRTHSDSVTSYLQLSSYKELCRLLSCL